MRIATWLLLLAALVACGNRTPTPDDVPADSGAEVVPWADLAPTHPDLPTRWIPPYPDPGPAEAAPPCRAGQLAASRPGHDGAGGTLFFEYDLTLLRGEPCRVEGAPDLQPLRGGEPVGVPVQAQTRPDDAYRFPALVGGPRPVHLWLAWPENWCAPPQQVDVLRMPLPGGHLDLAGPDDTPFCNGGSGPQPIEVWPFYPVGWRPARTVSAYGQVRATGDLALHGTPGAPVDFTITLTSPHDLVLEPCPDYTIAMYGVGVSEEPSYALNCAAVPFTDAQGRPMLPAGRPVAFAMRLVAPAADAGKLVWSLDAPGWRAVGGQVVVGDRG